ncbi:MAG: M28 family peptidase [Planctomycetota bacterium]|nr:M28 family peptidase [Planctomycetota bacterium]
MTDRPRERRWHRLFVPVLAVAAASAAASDADIQAVTDTVSEAQYTTYQHAIESMGVGAYGGPAYDQGKRGRAWTGTSGEPGNQEARKYLEEKLTAMGLAVTVQGQYLNVAAELPGTTTPDRIYVLCAHYDTGNQRIPGGDDDASGTAGVLEAARVLSQYSFESTIRFVCFNAEQRAFLGSTDYVRNVVRLGQQNVLGFINLDMIVHPYHDDMPREPFVMGVSVAGDYRPSRDWATTFIAATKKFVPDLAVDADSPYPNDPSNPQWFTAKSYPGFTASEDPAVEAGLANSYNHTAQDASDMAAGKHYDYGFATKVVKAAVATLAQEAGLIGASAGGGSPQLADSDSDGFPDQIEAALGSDPQDPASRPFNQPQATPSGALSVGIMTVKLNFTKGNADSIAVSGTVPLPVDFAAGGQTAIVDVGGVVHAFTLNAKGRSTPKSNTGTFVLRPGKQGQVQLGTFDVKLLRGSFAAKLADHGLRDATLPATPVDIPVTLIFNNETRSSTRTVMYRAEKSRAGVAK